MTQDKQLWNRTLWWYGANRLLGMSAADIAAESGYSESTVRAALKVAAVEAPKLFAKRRDHDADDN